jgi:hypothetical protein
MEEFKLESTTEPDGFPNVLPIQLACRLYFSSPTLLVRQLMQEESYSPLLHDKRPLLILDE